MTTALREFKDGDGSSWEVWDVVPTNPERRFQQPATPPGGVERRKKPQFRVNLGMAMANGWLIFASGARRRRLAPIPAGWSQMPDVELRRLLAEASEVERSTISLQEAHLEASADDADEGEPEGDEKQT